MASEQARARLLRAILFLVLPVTFGYTTPCRSPALTFSAAIHLATKRPTPCSAVLRHIPSSWTAVFHWSTLMQLIYGEIDLPPNIGQKQTAALVALAACSVILSGAVAPSPPWFGVFVCDGDRKASTISDWLDYLGKGLALDLLGRHFEGIASALACISIMIWIVLLVYPLQRLAPTAASMIGQPLETPMFSSLAVVIPCALACGVALWAEGLFRWGFASAVAVGLMSANLTLKATSFAKTSCGLSNAAKIVSASDTPAVGDDLSQLTFAEFVFFIVAAPSLVCVPRFLRRRARRTPRVTRALCEFSHAALSFLAIHAACSAMFAPTLRVISAATMAAPEHQAESTWIDSGGWEALPDGGGARWFCELMEALGGGQAVKDGGMFTCNAAPAWLQTTVAAAFGMVFFSPMAHFLMFYGFWHCTCLGCAELWGYPDRLFYGPWWLLSNDLRRYFRAWSTPVHRWLVSCVHTPILSCGINVNNGASGKPGRTANLLPAVKSTNVALAGDIPTAFVSTGDNPANSSAALMKGGESPTAAASTKSGGFGVGQTPCGKRGSQDGIGKAGATTSGWRLFAQVSVFLFSSVVHEAVMFVAMRRTCWPINSVSLMVANVIVAVSDKRSPPKDLIHEDNKKTEVEVGVGSEDAGLMSRRQVGSEWRRWGALALSESTSFPVPLLIDFLAWQWWRHAHLHHD